MGKIELEGMHFYAWHGHFEVEQVVGNQFLVNVKIEADVSKAAETDDLEDAINYQAVYGVIKEQMQIKSRLLENVAKRILDALYLKFPAIETAEIKISKLNPPMGGKLEKASITLAR